MPTFGIGVPALFFTDPLILPVPLHAALWRTRICATYTKLPARTGGGNGVPISLGASSVGTPPSGVGVKVGVGFKIACLQLSFACDANVSVAASLPNANAAFNSRAAMQNAPCVFAVSP